MGGLDLLALLHGCCTVAAADHDRPRPAHRTGSPAGDLIMSLLTDPAFHLLDVLLDLALALEAPADM